MGLALVTSGQTMSWRSPPECNSRRLLAWCFLFNLELAGSVAAYLSPSNEPYQSCKCWKLLEPCFVYFPSIGSLTSGKTITICWKQLQKRRGLQQNRPMSSMKPRSGYHTTLRTQPGAENKWMCIELQSWDVKQQALVEITLLSK